jgi:hypothetical protein
MSHPAGYDSKEHAGMNTHSALVIAREWFTLRGHPLPATRAYEALALAARFSQLSGAPRGTLYSNAIYEACSQVLEEEIVSPRYLKDWKNRGIHFAAILPPGMTLHAQALNGMTPQDLDIMRARCTFEEAISYISTSAREYCRLIDWSAAQRTLRRTERGLAQSIERRIANMEPGYRAQPTAIY